MLAVEMFDVPGRGVNAVEYGDDQCRIVNPQPAIETQDLEYCSNAQKDDHEYRCSVAELVARILMGNGTRKQLDTGKMSGLSSHDDIPLT